MLIDRLLFPITSLGPGNRLVIWTVGCSKHCYHCSNQELWHPDRKRDIDIHELAHKIADVFQEYQVEGITLTGGDPFEQPEELLQLLCLLKEMQNDILVYTGYTIEQLREILPGEKWREAVSLISVLIDGPYIDALNEVSCVLRGSSNQRIFYFDSQIRPKYEKYLSEGRKVQNVYYGNSVISVGIHNRE